MNKLLSLTAAGALLSSSALFGQIEINENLSLTGFIDMSYFNASGSDDEDGTSYDLDQMELDFLLSFGDITGQVDIDYQRDDINELDLEQAFITYSLSEETSVTAGKFLSYHGWETAEPTGLYQYSFAYGVTIPGYHNGVSLDHSAEWGSFGLAVLDSVYDDEGSLSDTDDYEIGFEAKVVLTPADGVTLYFGYANDAANGLLDDRELFNFWTSYEFGDTTLAFEYNDYSDTYQDATEFLAMYSVAVSENGTFTGRISNATYEYTSLAASSMIGSGQLEDEDTKYTVAYIQAVTDNLALVYEYSTTDRGTFRGDLNEFAIEALFTF